MFKTSFPPSNSKGYEEAVRVQNGNRNAGDEFVLTSAMAQKWQQVGLDGKEKESRILKKFEKC